MSKFTQNIVYGFCIIVLSVFACILLLPNSTFGWGGSNVVYSGGSGSSGGSYSSGGSSGGYVSTVGTTYDGGVGCSGSGCGSSGGYVSTVGTTYDGGVGCSGSSCHTTTTTTSCGSNCYNPPSCTDQCSTSGKRECSGSGYRICGNYDSDSCLEWGSTIQCGAGETCSNGSCIKTCTDQCSVSGKRECSGNGYRQCGNYDSDSCLEWGTVIECGANETCSNGSCISSCSDECSRNGLRACSGNGWKQCGNYDSDSCLEWGTVTNCDSDETCSNGSCVSTCTDECSTNGKRLCSGNGFKTCGNYDSDSCLEWSNITNCDTDETCSNGSCVEKEIDICTDTLSGSPSAKEQEMCDNEGGVMLCGNGWCKCNCEVEKPTVNLTSEGDGTCGGNFTLKWTTQNATSCEASGAWAGSKGTHGSQPVGTFDGTKTFTLKCWGKGGTASDSVTLTGNGDDNLDVDAGEDEEIDEDETVELDGSVDGDYDDVTWECNDGDLSDEDTLSPTFEPPTGDWDYDKVFTCTLTAENECGEDSDTVKIRVNYQEEDEDIDVNLRAEPSSGCAALNDVDLTAEVDDNSNDEDYKYYFDCEDDGDWDKTFTSQDDSYTAKNICDYEDPGTYTAKVKVTSAGRSATDTVTIKVKDCEEDETEGRVSITKTVMNVSGGSSYQATVTAQPGQVVGYKIVVKAIDGDAQDVFLIDRVPNNITNISGLVVDGKKSGENIEDGIDLGDIDEGDSVVVTYTANVAGQEAFGYGQTSLTNVASVSVGGDTASSEATVIVSKQAVFAATTVSTGFDGGSAAALAGLAGMVLVGAYMLKDKIAAMLVKKTSARELDKKIDYVKKNDLVAK